MARRPRRSGARRGVPRALLLATLTGVIVALVGAGVVVMDALRAKAALETVAADLPRLQAAALAGNTQDADARLAEIQNSARRAAQATDGALWSFALRLPWVGDDIRAVRVVATSADALARDVLPGMVAVSVLLSPETVSVVNGRIPLEPFEEAAPILIEASSQLERIASTVADIEERTLADPLRPRVGDVKAQFESVSGLMRKASVAIQMLPRLLGSDGPRTYLLLVQNNAEPRALGGIPGAVNTIEVTDGAMKIVAQTNAGGILSGLPEPALPLTAAESALFGEGLGVFMADVTFTPDFPRAAEMARAIWMRQIGGKIDGVIMIDVGALVHVLRATGPIALPPGPVADHVGGWLTSENAAQVLLNEIYRLETNFSAQDAFFASVGTQIFEAALHRPVALADLARALGQSAQEERLMAWFVAQEEQAMLMGTSLSGAIEGRDARDDVGFFVNDGSASKIGYYLQGSAGLESDCSDEEGSVRTLDVVLRLATPPGVEEYPGYISGGAVVPAGHMRANILVYSPRGATVDSVQVDGEEYPALPYVHAGRAVAALTVTWAPGEAHRFTVRLRTSGDDMLRLRATPLSTTTLSAASSCEA